MIVNCLSVQSRGLRHVIMCCGHGLFMLSQDLFLPVPDEVSCISRLAFPLTTAVRVSMWLLRSLSVFLFSSLSTYCLLNLESV
jgi:hypothetical protein